MNKKDRVYVIGPKLMVYGKKGRRQIKMALNEMGIPSTPFGIAWVLSIPVPIGAKEFYLTSKDQEALKMLRADFGEKLQDLLNLYNAKTE